MRLSIDTETEVVHSISPEISVTDQPVPRLCVLSYAVPAKAGLIHNKDPELVPTARALFERETIWANPPFDAAVLIEHEDDLVAPIFRAFEAGRIKDVLTREQLLDIANGTFNTWNTKPHTPYSLAGVALRRLGIRLDKDTWRLRYGELLDTPISQWPVDAQTYPKNDATSALLVFEDQETRRMDDDVDMLADEDRQVRASWVLHLMGVHGILVDQVALRGFAARVERDWEAARERLLRAGIVRSDGTRDTKAAQSRMERLGGTRLTDTGKLSLDAEACEATGDPLMIDYADFGSLLKLKSTYIAPMLQAQGLPLHPRWNNLVKTGRTSCARPNLQQLPQAEGVRQCYMARPGHVLVGRDYGSIELVSFAQTCLDLLGRSTIAEALREGKDAHMMVAATLLGIPYDEAMRQGKAALHIPRQLGKVGNYGFLGGLGAEKFAANVWRKTMREPNPADRIRLTTDEAENLRRAWKATWPEVREYFDMCGQRDCARLLRSGRCHADKSFTEMCNLLFQGPAADMAKDAGWRITWRQYMEPSSALYGTHCVIFAHDEWVLESPKGRAHAVADELGEVMLEAAREWFPDVPTTVGEAVIGSHWSK